MDRMVRHMDPAVRATVMGVGGIVGHLQFDIPIHPYAVAENAFITAALNQFLIMTEGTVKDSTRRTVAATVAFHP